jgi:uncharacterized protein (TIGR02001 family)
VAATSDVRHRGISLSDDRPAVRLSASYDNPSGVYVGAAALAGPTAHDGVQPLGYQANLGYARQLGTGRSVDVGVLHYDMTQHLATRYRVRYSEAYAGFATDHLTARVYYSPDYMGEHVETLYGEVGGSWRLSPNWRAVGRVGALTPLHPGVAAEIRKPQLDLSLGVARRLPSAEVQLAWTSASRAMEYPTGNRQTRNALVATLSYYF